MNNRQILQDFLATVQREQIYFCSILSIPITAAIRDAANVQMKECMNIETEATNIAASRGWVIRDISPGNKAIIFLITKFRHSMVNNDSRIASSLILHHTKSMIRVLTNLRCLHIQDFGIHRLAQHYLDHLSAAVHHLQGFL